MASSKDPPTALASGVPPYHAILFVLVMTIVALGIFPNDIDDLARVETFTHRVFPDLVSLNMLASIRMSIAFTCWYITFHMIFISKGWDVGTTYKPKSKLRNTVYLLTGLKTLCPFTSWSWIMLGTSYSLNGYIALMAELGKEADVNPWILRSALVLWEVSAPFALLVSAVVRYAIWPAVLAAKRPHGLGSFRNQMQHNMNSVYILIELCLLGGLPVEFAHISFHLLLGAIYIIFSWFNCFSYSDKSMGPQYLYWFLDTTLGAGTTIALAVLLSVLMMSFVTFYAISTCIEWTGPSLISHTLGVVLVSSLVVRTG